MPTFTMEQLAKRLFDGPTERLPVATPPKPKAGPIKLTLSQWETIATALRFEAMLQARTRKDRHPELTPEEEEGCLSIQECIVKLIGNDGTEAAFRGVAPVEK